MGKKRRGVSRGMVQVPNCPICGHGREDCLDREHLLRQKEQEAGLCYLKCKLEGMKDPVVMILDIRDRVAGDIGERLAGKEACERLRGNWRGRGIPTVIATGPRDDVRGILMHLGRTTALALRSPPPEGRYWAVVVAAGGNLLAAAEVPPAPADLN
jgi:hypothetical protein